MSQEPLPYSVSTGPAFNAFNNSKESRTMRPGRTILLQTRGSNTTIVTIVWYLLLSSSHRKRSVLRPLLNIYMPQLASVPVRNAKYQVISFGSSNFAENMMLKTSRLLSRLHAWAPRLLNVCNSCRRYTVRVYLSRRRKEG